ncbi:myb/SANT-like DNA-binding domain-containing protein 4 [Drosophila kikkawai]|uniref:Regulatory protein zeste n=1 Tax=Drosophila kikkawai TaxID=30033 RepID=A0A6P4IUA2_DROKI|nr:uncharacterized protein LOC108081443 [Drosophila kikkawai]
MLGNVKRLRAKNFSPVEERILETLVTAYQDVIKSKTNDAVTWRRKVDTWKRIGAEFSLQSGMERPWKALREKYINTRRIRRLKGLDGSSETRSEEDLAITTVSSICEDFREGFEARNAEESSTDTNPVFKPRNLLSSGSSDAPQEQNHSEYSMPNIKDETPDDLEERLSSNALADEKMILLKLQQDYYRDENSRAAEKHKVDMEKRGIEMEQLKMQIAKEKLEMERQQIEVQSMRLKNDLLELEVLERRGRISATELKS